MTTYHPAEVVPGSIRTETTVTTYVTIACGQCGCRFERFLYGQDTARCPGCNRLCRFSLDTARAAEAAPNVIPIATRRKQA